MITTDKYPEATTNELEYCMRYRLFLLLLKEIGKPKTLLDYAFFSLALSEIAVKPIHRVIAIRMSIRYNFEAGNFGAAATLIQVSPIVFYALMLIIF